MDFFALQERARRTSRVLVGAFLVSFAIVAVATTLAVTLALRTYVAGTVPYAAGSSWADWLAANLGFAAIIAAGTFGLMVVASLVRAASLGSGGGQVARQLGATQVVGDGSDPLQRRLVNVVEEMALASGVPVPEIYILEQEAGINAFASGLHHTNAAITVTRGALERLDRAELQGVIAHEFSHVLNGDMRLNQQLIGMSFGILVLSLVGRWLLRSVRFARRDRNNGGIAAVLAIGFALTVIGAIGVLLSRLIKAAVSRRRESLADASAVQFTREPEGLAGALKKIAGYTGQLSVVETEEVAHMLFARGSRSFSGLFATHPPLLERIKALDPTFDPETIRDQGAALPDSPASTDERAGVAMLAPVAQGAGALLARAGSVGEPEVGGALRAALPDEVYGAARSRDSSLLLVLAFALAPDEQARERQVTLLVSQLGAVRAKLCGQLFADLETLDPKLRLPLLELALPALRQRPAEHIRFLFELLERVVALDPDRRLFDFVLLRVLEAYLREHPGATRTADTVAASGREDRRAAVRTLLVNVAAFGQEDAANAAAAYQAGLATLGWNARSDDPAFTSPAALRDLEALEKALKNLADLRPRDKRRILDAVLATMRADRKIEIEEQELFRAVSAALDCPIPPGYMVARDAGGGPQQIR